MVEFTVEEILMAEEPLSNLAETKLPVGLAFQVSKMIRVVSEELKEIRRSQLSIAERYGKKDVNGVLVEENGMYSIVPEHMESFRSEMGDLLQQKVSLNITPVPLASLEGNVELTVADFIALDRFIEA